MRSAADVDKNLAVADTVSCDSTVYYDVLCAPFRVYGVFYENGAFRRMPQTVAESVSTDTAFLHTNTSGGRVRFRTDSPFITIHAAMFQIGKMPHFALTGSAGFDLHIDGRFFGTFVPPFQLEDGYISRLDLGECVMRDITIHFPLYSGVSSLAIGLKDKATVLPPHPYRFHKPIVYYGSSITQGACASKPGNSYPNILSSQFSLDHINLGFSGCARAEEAMTRYLASLDMAMLVLDYDHNAPTKEHLASTHKRLFDAVRDTHPTLPVLFMTNPTMPRFMDDRDSRRDIIHETYQTARKSGDENVYFLDGSQFFIDSDDCATVEGCHPNDLGFRYMADAVGNILKLIFPNTLDSSAEQGGNANEYPSKNQL